MGFPLADFGKNEVGKVACSVTLIKYRTREDGIDEKSPLPEDQKTMTIDDLYAEMAETPSVAAAFEAMVVAVKEIGIKKGKI